MTWDITTAQARFPKMTAPEVTALMDASVLVLEGELNRHIIYKAYTEERVELEARGIHPARAYPIDSAVQVTVDGQNFDGSIEHDNGLMYFNESRWQAKAGSTIKIQYTGGFNPLPADLEVALWGIFDSFAANAASAGNVSLTNVDSVTIPDVGTVRFSNQDFPAQGSTGINQFGPMFSLVIDKYRRPAC